MEATKKSFLIIIFVLLANILGVPQSVFAEKLPDLPPGNGELKLYCLGSCPPSPVEEPSTPTPSTITEQSEVITQTPSITQTIVQASPKDRANTERPSFIQQLLNLLNSLFELLRQLFGGIMLPIDKPRVPDAFVPNGSLSQYMDKLVAEDKFSGVVLVAKDGNPVFEKAYGMANKPQNIPNDVNTKFNLGSTNKMFTGVAITQLAEKGKLSFDDPIGKYISGFPAEIGTKVTIHQLLTHTGGMGDFLRDPQYRSNANRIKTIQEMMSFVVSQPLRFEPGSRHEYSNSGFLTLGAIIEKVSGQDYYSYIKDHIAQPAGMNDTDFYEKDDVIPNLAHGYIGATEPRTDNEIELPLKGSSSGGGYSTAKDMLQFSKALLENKLLSKNYTDIVMTGKVPTPIGQYAYGFEDLQTNGQRMVGHSGGFPGVSASFRIFMKNGYVVIILSNYDEGVREPYEKIIQLL